MHRTRPRHVDSCRETPRIPAARCSASAPPGCAPACPAWRALSSTTRSSVGENACGQHGFESCGARLHSRHIVRSSNRAKSQLPSARQAAHNGTMTRRPSDPGPTHPTRPRRAGPATCQTASAMGEYRAPKSRRNLNEYWWFCLEHVRAYNADLGLLQGHVSRADRGAAPCRHRLAAPFLAARPAGQMAAWDEDVLRDPLHLLAAGRVKRGPSQAQPRCATRIAGAAGDTRSVLADHARRGENTLQGTGQAAPSGRQRRRPRSRGTT